MLSIGTAIAETRTYTTEEMKEMSRFSSIEHQQCSHARYPSVKNRLACQKEVRIEIYEKRLKKQIEE